MILFLVHIPGIQYNLFIILDRKFYSEITMSEFFIINHKTDFHVSDLVAETTKMYTLYSLNILNMLNMFTYG